MREAKVQLCLFHLCLSRLYRGCCREIRLDVVVQLTLGDSALLRQGSVAVHIELGFAALGLSLSELSLGLVKYCLKGTRIDLEEHLALADKGAFLVALLDEISTHLRLDLCVDVPVQRRDPFAVYRDVLLHDADNLHLRGWRRRRRFFALAT